MKIIRALFLVFIVGLSATSCEKYYVCTCTSIFSGGDYTSVTNIKGTKKNAQSLCTSMQSSNVQQGVSTNCTLN